MAGARRQFTSARRSITFLQGCVAGRGVRRQFLQQRHSAVVIQAAWRGALSRGKQRTLQAARVRAASSIQAAWRRHVGSRGLACLRAAVRTCQRLARARAAAKAWAKHLHPLRRWPLSRAEVDLTVSLLMGVNRSSSSTRLAAYTHSHPSSSSANQNPYFTFDTYPPPGTGLGAATARGGGTFSLQEEIRRLKQENCQLRKDVANLENVIWPRNGKESVRNDIPMWKLLGGRLALDLSEATNGTRVELSADRRTSRNIGNSRNASRSGMSTTGREDKKAAEGLVEEVNSSCEQLVQSQLTLERDTFSSGNTAVLQGAGPVPAVGSEKVAEASRVQSEEHWSHAVKESPARVHTEDHSMRDLPTCEMTNIDARNSQTEIGAHSHRLRDVGNDSLTIASLSPSSHKQSITDLPTCEMESGDSSRDVNSEIGVHSHRLPPGADVADSRPVPARSEETSASENDAQSPSALQSNPTFESQAQEQVQCIISSPVSSLIQIPQKSTEASSAQKPPGAEDIGYSESLLSKSKEGIDSEKAESLGNIRKSFSFSSESRIDEDGFDLSSTQNVCSENLPTAPSSQLDMDTIPQTPDHQSDTQQPDSSVSKILNWLPEPVALRDSTLDEKSHFGNGGQPRSSKLPGSPKRASPRPMGQRMAALAALGLVPESNGASLKKKESSGYTKHPPSPLSPAASWLPSPSPVFAPAAAPARQHPMSPTSPPHSPTLPVASTAHDTEQSPGTPVLSQAPPVEKAQDLPENPDSPDGPDSPDSPDSLVKHDVTVAQHPLIRQSPSKLPPPAVQQLPNDEAAPVHYPVDGTSDSSSLISEFNTPRFFGEPRRRVLEVPEPPTSSHSSLPTNADLESCSSGATRNISSSSPQEARLPEEPKSPEEEWAEISAPRYSRVSALNADTSSTDQCTVPSPNGECSPKESNDLTSEAEIEKNSEKESSPSTIQDDRESNASEHQLPLPPPPNVRPSPPRSRSRPKTPSNAGKLRPSPPPPKVRPSPPPPKAKPSPPPPKMRPPPPPRQKPSPPPPKNIPPPPQRKTTSASNTSIRVQPPDDGLVKIYGDLSQNDSFHA